MLREDTPQLLGQGVRRVRDEDRASLRDDLLGGVRPFDSTEPWALYVVGILCEMRSQWREVIDWTFHHRSTCAISALKIALSLDMVRKETRKH